MALVFHQRADQRDGAAPQLDDLPTRPQRLPRRPLRGRGPMGRPIPAASIGLGQRGAVTAIGLHPTLRRAVP